MYRDSRRLRIALALLIALSFTMITVDYRAGEGSSLRWLRSGAASVLGPVQRAVNSVVQPVGDALSTLGDLGGLHDEVERLRKENEGLREQLRQTDDARRAAADMEKLLGLAGRGRLKIVPARVIALGPGNFEWTATLDIGRRDGVRKDQTVVNGDGLVGRVIEVGPYTAQVLLAIDPTFTVSSRMAVTGEMGSATGRGLKPMRLELIRPEARVGKNEPVVTMTVARGFVASVPIGVATKVERARTSLTATVQVTPYVDFTALDAVGVVVEAPRDQPRNAMLPTAPPSPSASPRPGSSCLPGSTRTPASPASPATPTSPCPSQGAGGSPAPSGSATRSGSPSSRPTQ